MREDPADKSRLLSLCILTVLVLSVTADDATTVSDFYSEAKFTDIFPSQGSRWGGLLLTLKGEGFAENQFNFGDGNDHLGNKVTLRTETQSWDCDIHKDGCTELQITCTTPKLPEGKYWVVPQVDGKHLKDENKCTEEDKCMFEVKSDTTPTLTEIAPVSGQTGQEMTIRGMLFTDAYGTNNVSSTNNNEGRFSRVYLGSKNCELKDAVGNHNIALDSDTSKYGTFTCRQSARDIGYLNASFIIDIYGRSKPAMDVLRVGNDEDIYMYQSYAEITGINPASGSENGRTRLTITGNNFENTRFGNPEIMVAGTPCEIVGEFTMTELVCETSAQPADANSYEGNRGLKFEIWKDTPKSPDEFDTLLTTAADYATWNIDSSDFNDDTDEDQFSARASGYFVAPATSEYRFYVLGDDDVTIYLSTDSNPANIEELASARIKSSYYDDLATQQSKKVNLVKGQSYYMEVRMKEGSSHAFFKVAALMYTTDVKASMAGAARAEIQKVKVASTVVKDTQEIAFTVAEAQAGVYEIQTVTVTGNPDTQLRLALFDVFTVPLSASSSAGDVEDALSELPTIAPDTVTVTEADVAGGKTFTVTFNGDKGDLPDLTYMHVDPTATDCTVEIEETQTGMSTLATFSFSVNGVPTESLQFGSSSASKVRKALLAVLGARCPDSLLNPPTSGHSEDYENSLRTNFGTPVTDEPPFCGRTSALNPIYLYKKTGDADSRGLALSKYSTLCFAYRGAKKELVMKYTYRNDEDEKITRWRTFFQSVDKYHIVDVWLYHCEDIYQVASTHFPGMTDYLLEQVIIKRYEDADNSDMWVDAVTISRSATTEDTDNLEIARTNCDQRLHACNLEFDWDHRLNATAVTISESASTEDTEGLSLRIAPQVKMNQSPVRDVEVTKDGKTFTITLDPHDCDNTFQLITMGHAQKTAGSVDSSSNSVTFRSSNNGANLDATTTRLMTATKPVEGTFTIGFNGETTQAIGAFSKERDVGSQLEQLGNTGNMAVERSGDCANHHYTLTWLSRGGDQPDVTYASSLTGNNVALSMEPIQDGGVFFDTIQGDMLKTIHDKPQVTASFKGMPSLCSGDCSFEWTTAATPSVSNISPDNGKVGTSVTVTGTGFTGEVAANTVEIGNTACDVVSVDATTITCTAPDGPVGLYDVTLVSGSGKASGSVQFTFNSAINSIAPTTGGSGGGTVLTISGFGFGESVTVTIGGNGCDVITQTRAEITCSTPPADSSSVTAVDVIVTHNSQTTTSPTQFTYDYASTPEITALSASTSDLTGGESFTLTGTGFGASATGDNPLTLCESPAEIETYTDTQIVAKFPPNPPGNCKVMLNVGAIGDALSGSISEVEYKLKVTNVFPLVGSIYGGLVLTLTGEGFVQDNTSVSVGEHQCEITALTSTSVTCEIADTGTLHVVENTGTHHAFGRGYGWEPVTLGIGQGDRVVFKWRTPDEVAGIGYRVYQVNNASTSEHKAGGFTSGDTKSESGSFTRYFPDAGTYYYSSGLVDGRGQVELRGNVRVTEKPASVEVVAVRVAGFEAMYEKTGSDPTDSSSCPGTNAAITPCTETEPADGDATKFNVKLLRCSSATVTALSVDQASASTEITVTGTGFSTVACQNKVSLGKATGTVSAATDTQLTFTIDTSDEPPVGLRDNLEVRVDNRGYARGGSSFSFTLLPEVTAMSPSSGSKAGGTKVTITGSGFTDSELFVNLEGIGCEIESSSYTEIVCFTESSEGRASAPVSVSMRVGSNTLYAVWGEVDNIFTFDDTLTPKITAVTPDTVSGASTSITITGSGLGTTAGDVSGTVGASVCTITTLTDTSIECDVGAVPVGDAELNFIVAGKGKAMTSVTINSPAEISSISPATGSTHGFVTVTITGNGFVEEDVVVTVDGIESDLLDVTPSQMTFTAPAHAAGGVDVIVTSKAVHNYPTQQFTYAADATPTLTSVSPDNGVGGDVVTATGTLFSTTPADNTLVIGESIVVATASTATSVTFTLANKPTGEHSARVVVAGKGGTDTLSFTYKLDVSGVTPSSGGIGGEQLVTVNGVGFIPDMMAVMICGNVCEFVDSVDNTDTVYKCLTPVPDSDSSQACDVEVSLNALSADAPAAYSYDPSLTPTISSVTPARGGTMGGTKVTITGSGFGTIASDVTVSIGGADCPITGSVSDTQVVCTTGESKSQKTKVKVDVMGNGKAKQDNADYWYIDMWSSQFTWGGLPPPVEGDFVVIQEGQMILLDTDTPVLKMLLIKGGQLIFDEKDVILQAENILITHGGLLQVGTESEPFQNKATIILHGHLRSVELPIYGAKTLAVRNGTLDLHGKHQSVMWSKLDGTVSAGSTSITLQHAVDWEVDDEIVIATTGDRHSQKESEVRKITAVSPDKKTLTLDNALTYEHLGVTLSINVGGTVTELEARAEVGLLSHNVVVRGSDMVSWHDEIEACEKGFDTGEFATQTCFQGRFGDELGSDQFGCQIMIHAPVKDTNIAIGRLSNVEVTYAGQAFRLGRYAVHFHLNGDMSQSYVRRSSIHRSFNRAINIHGTHNVMVEHNVLYNIMGGAMFLEDGIETGNTFQYNLAVFIISSTSLLNDDVTPAAFWATNPNNTYKHNAVAGGTHFGWWYRLHANPTGPSTTDTVHPDKTVFGTFFNNSVHSNGWFGIWIFENYFPEPHEDGTGAQLDGLTVWNCEKGAEAVAVGNVQFRNFIAINNEVAGIEFKQVRGIELDDETNGAGVYNGHIAAHITGLPPANTKHGISLPWGNGFIVKGVTFSNFDDPTGAAFKVSTSQGICVTDCGGFTYKISALVKDNSPYLVDWQWTHNGVLVDVDGTLTGTAGESVLPTMGILPSTCSPAPAAFNVGFNSSVCAPGIHFHRMSFNEPDPDSLRGKKAVFTNADGQMEMKYMFKRVTNPKGWMGLLVSGQSYKLEFQDAEFLTNFSYDANLHSFTDPSHHVVIVQEATKPDQFYLAKDELREKLDHIPTVAADYSGDWYFDETAGQIHYLVSQRLDPGNRRRKRSFTYRDVDRAVQVKSVKCQFKGCQPPPNVVEIMARPDPFFYWSDVETWPSNQLPQENDDLVIPADTWIVADIEVPKFKTVIINGGLEVESMTFELKADYIVIYGRLVIGWPDDPYLGLASLSLTGSRDDTPYPVEDGPALGSKFLAVYGGLDLNGKDIGSTFTSLAQPASTGVDVITLAEAVTWSVGTEVVISTTSYSAWDTEVRMITGVNSDGTVLTLNQTLDHDHSVSSESFDNGKSYSVSAKVGALTRNIKVQGVNQDGNMFDNNFGARVIVATTVLNDTHRFSGVASVKNVEFVYTGQEGYTSTYDPRFSLAFKDVEAKSSVTKCAFHKGFSVAVGVFGVKELPIVDNVIYFTVGSAIVTNSLSTTIEHNLVSLVVWTGGYKDRAEDKNLRWEAGIDAREATDVIIKNNVVAGSERAGIRVIGERCNDQPSAWSGNEVHSSMVGLVVFESEDTLISEVCVRFSNFLFWRNHDYGLYYNHVARVEVINMVSIEDGIGFFPLIVGPGALSHVYADKYAWVSESLFVGQTDTFDCAVHTANTDKNYALSVQARGFSRGNVARAGITFPSCQSGGNNAPQKPWINIMAYNAISCRTILSLVTFANFGTSCGGETYAMTPNKKNDDLTHQSKTAAVKMYNMPEKNLVFIPRSSVAKVNPSDCVDMECDGMKKVLIEDSDGTLLGSPGFITSQSEYEWDGDPRRGLGDYRIPKVMLTALNGTRLYVDNVAPNKGIVRSDQCTLNPHWQAYECHDIDYGMLVIESMDADTETRRLSPVAILSNQFVDLINGPQDHGWCAGYTCQKRISTFHAIVGMGMDSQIYFTGTAPQVLRLMMLNAEDDDYSVVGVYYGHRYRLDVYVEDVYILSTNGEKDGDKFKYLSKTMAECMPTSASVNGANCMDQKGGMMYVIVKGSSPVEIRTTKQVSVGLTFMTETEFFGDEIIANLAAFLEVPAYKIRIVNIVRESRRRKRSTTFVTHVQVECGDTPGEGVGTYMTQEELENAASQISTGALLGNLPIGPNGVTPDVVVMTEPVPDVASPEWGHVETDLQPYTVSKAGQMTFYEAAVPGREGQEFITPIRLRVYSEDAYPLDHIGTAAYPWRVEATLVKGAGSHANAALGGATQVNFTNGWANFTDLHISHAGSDYQIQFTVVYPSSSNFTELSPALTVMKRDLEVHMVNRTVTWYEDNPVSLTIGIKDRNTELPVSDIAWRGHTWRVTASMADETLGGTTEVNFDPTTGHATFTDLQFEDVGRYYVNFTVVSTPNDYAFLHEMYFDITNEMIENTVVEMTSTCQFMFDTTFNSLTSPRDVARFARTWAKTHKASGVMVRDSSATSGSVMATLVIEGSTPGVKLMTSDLCKAVQTRQEYMFGGSMVAMEPYMMVDGKNAYGVTCGAKEEKGLHPGVIAAIVLACVIFVAIIVLIIVWVVVIKPKTKTYDTASLETPGKEAAYIAGSYGNDPPPYVAGKCVNDSLSTSDMGDSNPNLRSWDGKYNIEDYLFREHTFNRGKNTNTAAPVATSGGVFNLNVDSRLDMYTDRPLSTRSNGSLPPKMPLPSD